MESEYKEYRSLIRSEVWSHWKAMTKQGKQGGLESDRIEKLDHAPASARIKYIAGIVLRIIPAATSPEMEYVEARSKVVDVIRVELRVVIGLGRRTGNQDVAQAEN